jgi:hypothetical protein
MCIQQKAFFTYVWTLSAAEAGQSILQMIHIIPSPPRAQIFTPVLSKIMLQSTKWADWVRSKMTKEVKKDPTQSI